MKDEYIWENAKIEKTFIGIEDHGIFAWGIIFGSKSWVQGGFDADTIKIIVTHFGPWEELTGKVVRITRKSLGGHIVAMRDILDDDKEVCFK